MQIPPLVFPPEVRPRPMPLARSASLRAVAALILALRTASAAAEATPVTLADAVERTLRASPELAPYAAERRAADARAIQAKLGPNPTLGLEVEDVLGSGDFSAGREAQTTLRVGREIELGGKRGARIRAAERAIDRASVDYEVARAGVLAELTKRFIRVLAAQEILDLAGRHVTALERGLAVARRRAVAGAASVADETRTSIALARGRLREEDSRHELSVALVALAASWGEQPPSFDRVFGSLAEREKVGPWEDVAARIDASPEMALRASERALREAELSVALARRIPDLGLSAGIRRLEGRDEQALVFGIEMPLPLFDRNQGGILESRAAVDRVDAERIAAEGRLRATLFALHQELLHAEHVLDAMEKEIVPDAERAQEAVRRGYERGTLSSLEVLDATRTAIEVQQERVEVAESFHVLRVEIARLTGSVVAEAAGGDLP